MHHTLRNRRGATPHRDIGRPAGCAGRQATIRPAVRQLQAYGGGEGRTSVKLRRHEGGRYVTLPDGEVGTDLGTYVAPAALSRNAKAVASARLCAPILA